MSIEDIIVELEKINNAHCENRAEIDYLKRDIVILKEDCDVYRKAADAARRESHLVGGFLDANENLKNVTRERDQLKALCEERKRLVTPAAYAVAIADRAQAEKSVEQLRARVAELTDQLNSKDQAIDGQTVLIDKKQKLLNEAATQKAIWYERFWEVANRLGLTGAPTVGDVFEILGKLQHDYQELQGQCSALHYRLNLMQFDIVRDGEVIRVVKVPT